MQKNKQKLLLLDTHVWIWLLTGSNDLKKLKVLKEIESGVAISSLRVSTISVWEVAMLESKGRITFKEDCLDWISKALKVPWLSLCPITPEIAVFSTRLPGIFHGDLADRLIISTAVKNEATIITKDKKIIKYAKENFVNILPV